MSVLITFGSDHLHYYHREVINGPNTAALVKDRPHAERLFGKAFCAEHAWRAEWPQGVRKVVDLRDTEPTTTPESGVEFEAFIDWLWPAGWQAPDLDDVLALFDIDDAEDAHGSIRRPLPQVLAAIHQVIDAWDWSEDSWDAPQTLKDLLDAKLKRARLAPRFHITLHFSEELEEIDDERVAREID